MIPTCFFCGEPKNEIVLLGAAAKQILGEYAEPDGKAPMHGPAIDKEPCDKCKGYMQQGVICIEVRDGETDRDNPYRTGGWWVVRQEAVERLKEIVKPESLIDDILRKRIMFVEQTVADGLGFHKLDDSASGPK